MLQVVPIEIPANTSKDFNAKFKIEYKKLKGVFLISDPTIALNDLIQITINGENFISREPINAILLEKTSEIPFDKIFPVEKDINGDDIAISYINKHNSDKTIWVYFIVEE